MRWIFPAIIIVLSSLILVGTSEMLPLVWDEGELIERAGAVKSWGGDVTQFLFLGRMPSDGHSPFSQESIVEHWKSTVVIEGHPGGYLAVIAVGKIISDALSLIPFLPEISPKTSWRFGTILFVSIALGIVFSAVRRHFGNMAAFFAVVTILLIPRLFAHLHFATCDGILTAAWLTAVATFPLQTPQKIFDGIVVGIVWGICLGMTVSAKFTGLAILVPLAVMILVRLSVLIRRRSHFREISKNLLPYLIGSLTAAFVFYLFNPPLWRHSINGFAKFLYLNTHRDHFNISIQFWKQMYDIHHPLPFYNTAVWIAITFPTLFLLVLPLGLKRMFSRKDSITSTTFKRQNTESNHRLQFSGFLLLNALILPMIRAFPGTPPHDGVRLFITAFAFLAIIAGIGMSTLWQISRSPSKKRLLSSPLCGRLAVVFLLLTGLNNIVFYAPQWLSFYNAVIGGVHGAAQRGFEPTYYWDSLDADVIQWLNQNVSEHKKIYFSAKSSKTMNFVRVWNGLQPEFHVKDHGDYQWYIIQHRPGAWSRADWQLMKHFTPVYTKYVHQPQIFSLQACETPVLSVFAFDDYLKAREMTAEK
ncbi:MAG: glycosyltransferase family 39 protein [Planctomycetaceae bacterium]|nr:glycosyltransferase family 39 protein [Planctomycetaceae bacterium]